MKICPTKLIFSFLSLFVLTAWAGPVARVNDLSGSVFVITDKGETKTLSSGDHLEEKSEVMVEEGASVMINDFYDSAYHLVGGSHLKIFDRSVQLKRGKIWVQSIGGEHLLALTTANGYVSFGKSEFVVSFDQLSNRSQVLVVNGEVEVSNILSRDLKHDVLAGTFTTIDPEVENGVPKVPLAVGYESLNSTLAEFKRLPSSSIVQPKRALASVAAAPARKGKIIFIKSSRGIASVAEKKSKKNFWKYEKSSSETPTLRIFGATWSSQNKPQDKISNQRTPASIKAVDLEINKTDNKTWQNDSSFLKSFEEHRKEQPKHPKELQNLIQDLKSF